MRWRCTGESEIFRGADDSCLKQMLPDSIDRDACQQCPRPRIAFGQSVCERQPAAAGSLMRYWCLVQQGRRIAVAQDAKQARLNFVTYALCVG